MKTILEIFWWSRRALSPRKVWGDVTTHANCRCENVVFVFFFVTFEGCIVWTSIALPLIGRFRGGFQRFWQGITLPDALHSSHFHRCLASQFSPNCGQKLRKVRKSAGKFCAQLSKDSWEIWRKFHRSSLGPIM